MYWPTAAPPKRADARADQSVLAALFAVRGVGQIAENRATQSTGDGPGSGIVANRTRTIGVGGGAGGGPQQGGDGNAGDDKLGAHGMVLFF
jgi:hypothetical protein